jgi:hypothetical protein
MNPRGIVLLVLTETIIYIYTSSDHVDDFWGGANDVSGCAPVHATNGSRHEFSLHPFSTKPRPDSKSTIHESSPAKSQPFELVSNCESTETL